MEPNINTDDNFIMSPKIDFAFKLLFGDPKNIDLLKALLVAILNIEESELRELKITNNELPRQFQEDKKGILDVRAKTKDGKEINIEIQVLATKYMSERTTFYWAKMYTNQIRSGETYDVLKKCITINIVDFECIPLNKIHTSYHITEDETGYKLTDILEIHYLELAKLENKNIDKDENLAIIQWMEFIGAESKEGMEVLAEKNEDIRKAYDLLQVMSKDEKSRSEYEAREAEIHDQMTRIKTAREEGINIGIDKGINIGIDKGINIGIDKGANEKALRIAEKMIKRGDSIEDIVDITELLENEIIELRNRYLH